MKASSSNSYSAHPRARARFAIRLWVGLFAGVFVMACAADEPEDPALGPGPSTPAPGSPTPARPLSSPRCAADQDVFRVAGSIDAIAVSEERTENINAGLTNFGEGTFDTPIVDFAPLEPESVELHLTWSGSLGYGASSDSLRGTLLPPASHPRMGQVLCVTAGLVGFSADAEDEGSFWFAITGATLGTPGAAEPQCGTEVVPIDLQGCYQ